RRRHATPLLARAFGLSRLEALPRKRERLAQQREIVDLVGQDQDEAGVQAVALRLGQALVGADQGLVEVVATAGEAVLDTQRPLAHHAASLSVARASARPSAPGS